MAPIAIQELKHDHVEPDPRNPRQACNEEQLTELANDIAVRGVLQPIVVRPHPTGKGRFMIVFGERRWRAAGMVDAATVPCIVRQYDSELAVLEDQIAENGKRADVHPLEEADAYRRLHEEHGREVEEIAELTSKSKAYVYAAMKLCALSAEPRRAFLAGKFDKSVALLIARLPTSQQTPATKAVLEQGDDYNSDSTVMSYREAKQYITDEFMLRLATAPFKVNDETLVPKAGPCTTCLKRTGNQRELFADVVEDRSSGGADVCTDSTCYKAKVDVHWSRVAAAAKEKGKAVLEGQAADRAGSYGDKHVRLDDHCYEAGGKTYRQLLGKHAEDAVTAVARDQVGHVKELVAKADLPKLLKSAGVKVKKEPSGQSPSQTYEREQREERELGQAVTAAMRETVLGKLDGAGDVLLWKLLARVAVRVSRSDAQRELMKLHEVKSNSESHYSYGQRGALLDYVDGLPVRAARDFAVELLLAEAGAWNDPEDESDYTDKGMTDEDRAAEKAERREYQTGVEHAIELFGIDAKAVVEKVKQDLAAARKAKAEAKKKPKKQQDGELEIRHKLGCELERFVFIAAGAGVEYHPRKGGKTSTGAGGFSERKCPKCDSGVTTPALPSPAAKAKKNGVAPAAEAGA